MPMIDWACMSQAHRNHEHCNHPRSILQQFILGSLAVLWIAVLPWLCWGGWSNPHHPHPNPHFVFGDPPLLDEGHHIHHVHPADPLAPADQDPLAGVARPDTLLIVLLVLLLPMIRVATAFYSYNFRRALAMRWARVTALAVPTPPPRTFLPLKTV